MWLDSKRAMYIGYTTRGTLIGVTVDTMLGAIKGAIATGEDINSCLDADMWLDVDEVYEESQMEATGMPLEEALSYTGIAVLEREELTYMCTRVPHSKKLKVVVSSEQCEDVTNTYANMAMAYGCMQALEYISFQVFSGWSPYIPASASHKVLK